MGENTFHVKCYEATTQHLEKELILQNDNMQHCIVWGNT